MKTTTLLPEELENVSLKHCSNLIERLITIEDTIKLKKVFKRLGFKSSFVFSKNDHKVFTDNGTFGIRKFIEPWTFVLQQRMTLYSNEYPGTKFILMPGLKLYKEYVPGHEYAGFLINTSKGEQFFPMFIFKERIKSFVVFNYEAV